MKKDNCSQCGKETTNYVNILTGKGWKYESYCINCARAFFGKLSTKSMLKLGIREIQHCSYEWDSMIEREAVKLRNTNSKDFEELPFLWSEQVKNKVFEDIKLSKEMIGGEKGKQ